MCLAMCLFIIIIYIYQYITKIRGWDVFIIVFKKMENFSLNVFVNMVFIKKISVDKSPKERGRKRRKKRGRR